jgi:hypothetical protein
MLVPAISCLDDNSQNFANALPQGCRRRVPEAGHTIQGDNPGGLLDALRPLHRGNQPVTSSIAAGSQNAARTERRFGECLDLKVKPAWDEAGDDAYILQ